MRKQAYTIEALPQNISYCLIFGTELEMYDSLPPILQKSMELVEQLYAKNSKLTVIVSGDGRRLVGNAPKVLFHYLHSRIGIPKDQIKVDEKGYSTIESMRQIQDWIGEETFAFITDEWHLQRCNLICKKLGLKGYGISIQDLEIPELTIYGRQEWAARMEDRCELTFGKKRLYQAIQKVRFLLALSVGKRKHKKLRKIDEDPMSYPGKIATKICPKILEYLTKNINIIIVTGTNGKTSTCRLLEQQLKALGIACFANRSSANTYMGVTAEFLIHCNAGGKYKEQYAVIECDEGNLPKIAHMFLSKNITILVTNLFRDQLDRYGELNFTRKSILSGILSLPQANIILNVDCSMTASLSREVPNSCTFFGMNGKEEENISGFTKDAVFCPVCGQHYEYRSRIYAHLGEYFCPNCNWERPKRDVLLREHTDGTYSLEAGEKYFGDIVRENNPPYYCLYNSLGVATALLHLGFDKGVRECFALSYYNPGRFEKVTIDGCDFYVILVKNTVGYQQAMKRLPEDLKGVDLVFGLNDRANDGRDVSWIWDCDYSPIKAKLSEDTGLYIFGDRYANMAVRLKYADFNTEKMIMTERFSQFYEQLKQPGRSVYIFANYTAMFSVRVFFSRRTALKKFWEEE